MLALEGVDGVYYAWLNGVPLGYSQDSRLPSEFDTGAALAAAPPGTPHVLAVQVRRVCSSCVLP